MKPTALILFLIASVFYACRIGPVQSYTTKYKMDLYLKDSGYSTKSYQLRCIYPIDSVLDDALVLDYYGDFCRYEINKNSHIDTFELHYNKRMKNEESFEVVFSNFTYFSNTLKVFQINEVNNPQQNHILLKINY